MNRRHLLKITAAGLAAAAVLRAQPPMTKLRFTLDFRVTGQTAPFFVAQYKGYFAEEGLDVAIDVGNGSVASITRVASGAYDLGFGDISSLIEYNVANLGTPAVQAVYQYYNRAPFAIIGRRDRGVTDFKSLSGKRIAAAAVESTKRSWPMVARKVGMKPDTLSWVTTDFASRDNVVVRGDVDGATYFHDSAVSLFQRMKLEDLAVLSYADAGVNVYGNAVLASTKLINENPRAVAGFVRATNRALRETLLDPAAAMPHVKKREPLIDEKVELERFRITSKYVAAPDTRAHGIGDIRKLTLDQQVEEVAEVYGLKFRPSADAIYNLSFLPPRSERVLPA